MIILFFEIFLPNEMLLPLHPRVICCFPFAAIIGLILLSTPVRSSGLLIEVSLGMSFSSMSKVLVFAIVPISLLAIGEMGTV